MLAVLLYARVRVVYELDVGEGEVADLAVQLPLPLAVDGHLGHLHDVADLEPQRRLVVRVGDARLLHACIRRKFALEEIRRTMALRSIMLKFHN